MEMQFAHSIVDWFGKWVQLNEGPIERSKDSQRGDKSIGQADIRHLSTQMGNAKLINPLSFLKQSPPYQK